MDKIPCTLVRGVGRGRAASVNAKEEMLVVALRKLPPELQVTLQRTIFHLASVASSEEAANVTPIVKNAFRDEE